MPLVTNVLCLTWWTLAKWSEAAESSFHGVVESMVGCVGFVVSSAIFEMRLALFPVLALIVFQRGEDLTCLAECHSLGRIGEGVGFDRVLDGSSSRYVMTLMML